MSESAVIDVAENPVLVDVREIEHVYRRRIGGREDAIKVLSHTDFRLRAGERVAIQGASGTGKTTLLNLLGGLDRPESGTHLHRGRALPADPDERSRWRQREVGFIFQFHGLLPEFTAVENVALAGLIAGWSRREATREAGELLRRMSLSERAEHYPDELSGGEQQRVSIARALVRRPPLLLADEPTGNLDPQTGDRVFDELIDLQKRDGFALVVATHSRAIAARCHRILHLEGGRLENRAASTDATGKTTTNDEYS